MASNRNLLQMVGAIEFPIPTKRRGVYFLTKGKEVVYVGKTEDVTQRVGAHIKAKDFDGFSFMPYTEFDLSAYERAWIRILQPKLNVQSMEPPSQGDIDHLKRALSVKYFGSVRKEIERRYAAIRAADDAAISGRLNL